MTDDDETVQLLRQAVWLLRLIAGPQIRELNERFEASMLTSEKRRAMWSAMDGTKTLAEIGKQVEISGEAVRQFVREVEENFPELVEDPPQSGAQRPERRII